MALSPHVPELRALELLVTVARTGSFGRAAREHGISQAAVSSRIRYNERIMRMPLFERSPDGVRTTPAGALVVEWAREVLASVTLFDEALAALQGDSRAHLRVSASMTAAEYLVPSFLITMQTEHPGVEVCLTAANSAAVARRVLNGEDQLGFVEGPDMPTGLKAIPVRSDRLEVVVAPGHRWARRTFAVAAAELATTALVHREAGSGTRETLVHALRALGLEMAHPVMEMSSTTAVKAAVAAGAAPAVISALAVTDELGDRRLVRVRVDGIDLTRTMYAVWSAGRPLLGPARDFLAIARRAQSASPGLRTLRAVAS